MIPLVSTGWLWIALTTSSRSGAGTCRATAASLQKSWRSNSMPNSSTENSAPSSFTGA